MSIAVITTTINIPRTLEWVACAIAPLDLVIACDLKTPDDAYTWLDKSLRPQLERKSIGLHVLKSADQHKYKCSEPIGFNNIQRRNIALLHAMRLKPRTIVSVDDDNIPMIPEAYPTQFDIALHTPHSGLCVSRAAPPHPWFDVGQWLVPSARHRGFPISQRSHDDIEFVRDAKVGVAAGMCLGDPDISACDRISQGPVVRQVTEVLRAGLACPSYVWTVFNSQNTAIDAELAPAWFMWPFAGRYDDIYASLVVQMMMRWKRWHTHFGHPFVWQTRNQHDLVHDLRAELDGMEHVKRLTDWFDQIDLQGDTVLERTRDLWECIAETARSKTSMFDPRTIDAAFAFLDDCEKVLT